MRQKCTHRFKTAASVISVPYLGFNWESFAFLKQQEYNGQYTAYWFFNCNDYRVRSAAFSPYRSRYSQSGKQADHPDPPPTARAARCPQFAGYSPCFVASAMNRTYANFDVSVKLLASWPSATDVPPAQAAAVRLFGYVHHAVEHAIVWVDIQARIEDGGRIADHRKAAPAVLERAVV